MWFGEGCRRLRGSRVTQKTLSCLRGPVSWALPRRSCGVGGVQDGSCLHRLCAYTESGRSEIYDSSFFYAIFLCFLLICFVQSNSNLVVIDNEKILCF